METNVGTSGGLHGYKDSPAQLRELKDISHLPQPARARGRAMTTVVPRAKRSVVVAKPVRAKRTTPAADLAASEALEAAPEMLAASDEN